MLTHCHGNHGDVFNDVIDDANFTMTAADNYSHVKTTYWKEKCRSNRNQKPIPLKLEEMIKDICNWKKDGSGKTLKLWM